MTDVSTTRSAGIAESSGADAGDQAARSRNPRGEGDRLRLELLDAAADLLAETGAVESVSLRAIAARAGVSPTAVYRHFDDHGALLRAAVEYCWAEFEAAIAGGGAEADDCYGRLRSSGHAYMRFAFEQPGKYRVLFSDTIDLGREQHPVGDSAFDYLVGLIRDVLVARHDDRDPRFVAVQVHTWIHGIVDLIGRHRDFDWPPLDVMLDELAYRIGVDDPDAPPPERWTGGACGPTGA